MRRSLSLLLATAAVALLGSSATAAAQSPGVPPPGTNDYSCRSAAHPTPVILVHGTFADQTISWNLIAPRLKAAGYCLFSLDLVARGTAPMDQSADKLAAFARDVLARTGAAKVSFVGHSQGGMLPRYVAKFKGLLDQTEDIVGLAPSNHGTVQPLAIPAGVVCPACLEQLAGSPFMQRLNAYPEAPEPIDYTNVTTRYDEVVIPYTSGFLSGPAEVTNVTLQSRCPNDVTDHLGIIYDPIAVLWIKNALGRTGPADPNFRPNCLGIG